MNKIYTEVNKRSNNGYADVRFKRAAFVGDTAVITVVCKAADSERLQNDAQLKSLISDICGFNSKLRIEFKAEDMSVRALRDTAQAFVKKFAYAASIADGITAELEPPTVKLKMHGAMSALAKDDLIPRLDEYLKNSFIAPVKIETQTVEYTAAEEKRDAPREPKNYAVKAEEPIFGQFEGETALSAADASGNNDDLAVCGVLTMVTDFTSKGAGAKRSRPYQKFLLYDGEGMLQCRCFPHDGYFTALHDAVNKAVCVFGNTEIERGRIGETSMNARAVALCSADGLKILPLIDAPESYVTVRPKPYEEYVQASLFQVDEQMPPALSGTFVAFDFETTGLNVLYDKPTELGAVKIVDGVITETFTTLIDPQRPIPEEVQKKTGITDDMVKGKPLFDDVLPDFYKFTYGAALIGHNIAFDFPFLIKHGNRCGYAFGDRRTFDTMGIAPRAIPGIDVLTLDHVLEMLGLVNDNAHRALSDATATAKAFIAMQKKLYAASHDNA